MRFILGAQRRCVKLCAEGCIEGKLHLVTIELVGDNREFEV